MTLTCNNGCPLVYISGDWNFINTDYREAFVLPRNDNVTRKLM